MVAPDIDVLVVGAGIQGVGVAQALAALGHSVHVVEAVAPASGTSSRSSKLIHGGLRYLESFQFGLVRESLSERAILATIAPHLVRLVPFFIPVYRTTTRRPWQIRAGLTLYALLGSLNKDARFRRVPRAQWETLDGLKLDDLQAVFEYHDGQTDDAALCRAVLQSAEDLGATKAIGSELVSAQRDDSGWSVTTRSDERETTVRAGILVNAAGPWANQVAERIRPQPPRRAIDLVGGTHIEIEGTLERGIYYTEAPADQRAVFSIPWKGHIMVGTTETPYDGDPRTVAPHASEIEYLQSTLRHYFPTQTGELIRAWAGLRVLPQGEGNAFNRPREVILLADAPAKPSVVTIYGGKLTGYRHTAQRVAKLLAPSLPTARRQADTRSLRLPQVD